MSDVLHLGDEVEFVTDAFAEQKAPRGTIGVIVDDWADGSNDVEITDPHSGELVARIRAAEGDIQLYSGPIEVKEPRKHGILFGRGDDLGGDVEEPPMPDRWGSFQISGYSPASLAFSQSPPEDAQLTDDIPWELRDEPPSEPVFN
jgi:hypothetical protein